MCMCHSMYNSMPFPMYNSMPFHTPRPFAPSPRPYVPLTTLLQSPRNRLHQVCFVTLRGSRGHDPALPPLSRKRAYPVSFTAYVPFLGPLCHSLALCAAPWPVAPLLGPLRRSLALCATLQGPLRHLQGPMCHSQQSRRSFRKALSRDRAGTDTPCS